jgi:hypothetical protein
MTQPIDAQREQRKNEALRALINEMMLQVRDATHNAGAWTPEERARAEAELSAIMTRVRGEALQRSGD